MSFRFRFRFTDPAVAASRAAGMLRSVRTLGVEDAAERAELLAAGVPAARVGILYPSGFQALVPAICELLGKPLGSEELDLGQVRAMIPHQINYVAKGERGYLSKLASDFARSDERELLRNACIAARAPGAPQQQVDGIEVVPLVMAYSYWIMEQRDSIPKPEDHRAVDEVFYQLYAYLMPQLAVEAAP